MRDIGEAEEKVEGGIENIYAHKIIKLKKM